jgi:hypothetical protein
MLLNHSNVRRVQEKPVVLQWYASEYDVYDTYDGDKSPYPVKQKQQESVSEISPSYKSQISQDIDSKEKDNTILRPDELPKLHTKTGTIFYLCPISGCKISNIHSEEIYRHIRFKHNIDL